MECRQKLIGFTVTHSYQVTTISGLYFFHFLCGQILNKHIYLLTYLLTRRQTYIQTHGQTPSVSLSVFELLLYYYYLLCYVRRNVPKR